MAADNHPSQSTDAPAAIIFGGAGCIGSATGVCFLRRGFTVVVVDRADVTSPDLARTWVPKFTNSAPI